MHRTASTADISEYKINEGAIKLLSVSDLILLIASLVMVATGIQHNGLKFEKFEEANFFSQRLNSTF